jgi:hypothetical protein
MTKLIGIKELQTNTKRIREESAKGVHFIVVYRSKPVFEIKPIEDNIEFAEDLKASGLYTNEFTKKMEKAEKDVKNKKTQTFSNTEEFLKSLS